MHPSIGARGARRSTTFDMTTTLMSFTPGDLVRIALPPPSLTDPVGEVVAVTPPGAPKPEVVVRWPSGSKFRYHPSALEPVQR